jgi:uncharacterized membrane protein YeaQ/YmgE (transglycosylase-associated protein family)
MTISTLVSWVICGLIVGLIARFLVPGRQSLSLSMTTVLGIAGACVGGFLYWMFKGQPGVAFTFRGDAWHGWILAIVGSALLLWAFPIVSPKRW